MNDRYLIDENLPPWWPMALMRALPGFRVWHVGQPGAPPRGTLDPEILIWCEAHGYLLLTNNRASMPGHLADHLGAGRHVPGILVVSGDWSIAELANELQLIAGA